MYVLIAIFFCYTCQRKEKKHPSKLNSSWHGLRDNRQQKESPTTGRETYKEQLEGMYAVRDLTFQHFKLKKLRYFCDDRFVSTGTFIPLSAYAQTHTWGFGGTICVVQCCNNSSSAALCHLCHSTFSKWFPLERLFTSQLLFWCCPKSWSTT